MVSLTAASYWAARRLARAAAGLSAAIACAATALALSVNPILVDLSDGGQTSGAINVINNGQGDMPVELTVQRLSVGPNGETNLSAGGAENFLIFPPQAMIKPGATQVFRVQWVSPTPLAKSESYIFSVSQLPVKLPEGVSGVQLLYEFQVVVNVKPQAASPALSLVGTGVSRNDEGKPVPVLEVQNAGAAHGYLTSGRLRLRQVGANGATVWSETYEPDFLRQTLGIGLVPPQAKRKFTLPFVLPQAGGRIEATLEPAN